MIERGAVSSGTWSEPPAGRHACHCRVVTGSGHLGHPPVRHWRRLLVGARNQDEAHALAAAIHAQAPPWAVISVLRLPGWLRELALRTAISWTPEG
jgi:hypothetical protein